MKRTIIPLSFFILFLATHSFASENSSPINQHTQEVGAAQGCFNNLAQERRIDILVATINLFPNISELSSEPGLYFKGLCYAANSPGALSASSSDDEIGFVEALNMICDENVLEGFEHQQDISNRGLIEEASDTRVSLIYYYFLTRRPLDNLRPRHYFMNAEEVENCPMLEHIRDNNEASAVTLMGH